jgi:hypothetical protein
MSPAAILFSKDRKRDVSDLSNEILVTPADDIGFDIGKAEALTANGWRSSARSRTPFAPSSYGLTAVEVLNAEAGQ